MTFRKQLKARYRSNRGFTLIEVLLSLTIMALITGVAFAGLSIGMDSWERGSRKIEELDRRFSVERLIQRQLPLAVPGQFVGRSNELEFISTYSLANGPTEGRSQGREWRTLLSISWNSSGQLRCVPRT